jgi:hypothetical protein
MKRTILLGTALISAAAALGACSSTPEPGDGSGGAASGGRTNSGGAKGSGGRTGTGGKASTGGGSSVSGGGPSSGGQGGSGAMGGDMGGMGGDMGGSASAVEVACAASCAVTTTIKCPGHEDLAACEETCVSRLPPACEAEYVALKTCEGNDSPSGFACQDVGGYVFVDLDPDTSLCTAESNENQECFVANP